MSKLFFLGFFAAFFVCFSVFPAHAESLQIASSDGEDAFAFAELVESDVPLLGDLVSAGYSIRIDEPVGQDVSAAGFLVQIFGDVGDDVRIAGNMITIAGKVADNVFAAGSEIILRDGSEVGGDFWAVGETVEINAPILGSVRVNAQKVIVNARISGDVRLNAADIEFQDSGFIAGSLEYWSPNENVSVGRVGGDIVYHKSSTPHIEASSFERKIQKMWSAESLLSLISMLVIGALVLYFFRNYFVSFSGVSKKSPFVSMGIGFLTLLSLPILTLILAITVIGLPLSFLSLLVLGFIVVLAVILDAFVIGSFIFPVTKKTPYWHVFGSFSLGSVILFLLPLIPLGLGYIFAFLVFLVSLGSLVRCHYAIFLDLKKRKKI